jgi:hypothetical protein
MGDKHIFVMQNGYPILVEKEDGTPPVISFPEVKDFTIEDAEEFMCLLIDGITKARELDNDPI